jgi:hypothetical protein
MGYQGTLADSLDNPLVSAGHCSWGVKLSGITQSITCTYQRPARGVHPRDNRGETGGNLVFCPCILPVNPGEITNFTIIGLREEGTLTWQFELYKWSAQHWCELKIAGSPLTEKMIDRQDVVGKQGEDFLFFETAFSSSKWKCKTEYSLTTLLPCFFWKVFHPFFMNYFILRTKPLHGVGQFDLHISGGREGELTY